MGLLVGLVGTHTGKDLQIQHSMLSQGLLLGLKP